MNEIEKDKNEQCLFTLLKNVSLVGNPDILPYWDVDMIMVQMDPNQIRPSAFYVLEDNLNNIRMLSNELDVDFFNLKGFYEFEDGSIIIPPLLEEHIVNGREQLILIDGQHRLFVARERGIELVSVVLIRNSNIPCPVLPLESWDDVIIVNQIPKVKRLYNPRIPLEEISCYYRKLPGSSGERRIKNTDI